MSLDSKIKEYFGYITRREDGKIRSTLEYLYNGYICPCYLMTNGSLEKRLENVTTYCLDILQRINIMIAVASVLEYLYHGYLTRVVHCDVKPSNVLLNECMVVHLGDCGIAKVLRKRVYDTKRDDSYNWEHCIR